MYVMYTHIYIIYPRSAQVAFAIRKEIGQGNVHGRGNGFPERIIRNEYINQGMSADEAWFCPDEKESMRIWHENQGACTGRIVNYS